jgi:N-acetylated-alpha-linked acidic dipeptidase
MPTPVRVRARPVTGMTRRLLPTIAATLVASLAGVPARAQQPLRGYPPEAARAEAALEGALARGLSRDSTRRWFRMMTARPHPAGSRVNRQLADSVAHYLRAWGWEDVALRRYDVLLPWPTTVSLQLLGARPYRATLTEDCLRESPKACVGPELTYFGMSGSGDITAEVVYANSGNPADYDTLEAHGVSVKGKIAIVRYSNPYSYRGFKALTAERRGVKALLIYSDPNEDGYRKGLVHPDGPWGNLSHIQRGALTYDFNVAGDPLTPGVPSIPGVPRIPVDSSLAVPHIVALPVSARDAQPFLAAMGGPVAPAAWQGALPITYRLGGSAKARVNVQMDGKVRDIWVVEGRLRGTDEPDKTVVLGNHRDAWVFGGFDPASGTATQMELARVLGQLAKAGQRPRRTIVIGNWDAEEWHLTGSTEWGEQFAKPLTDGGVAYLNVDGSTNGSAFSAAAVATMNPLVLETARDVTDPNTGKPLLDAWRGGGRSARGDTLPVTNTLGSGSDYTVFLNWLGMPVVDLAFNGPYGVYHSQYDDQLWMETHGDPGYKYMTAMAEVWGRMALRIANAPVLPWDVPAMAARVREFLVALPREPGMDPAARDALRTAGEAAAHWQGVADQLAQRLAALDRGQGAPADARALNEALRTLEQQWLLEGGIPGRPWFKHALYAPRETYAAMELPGVREALDARNWTLATRELQRLTARIQAVEAKTAAALAAAGR